MQGGVNYNGNTLLSGGINVNTNANVQALNVQITENGERTITPPEGVDGYAPITIDTNVPIPPAPVLETLNATENITYTPPVGVDGYNEVNVNVPIPTPVLETLNATENITYTPPVGVDGYDEVNVNVPIPTPVLETLNATENRTYTPPVGVDGYDEVNVNVPIPEPVLDDITITENGTYTPPSGVDGYNEISVNVSGYTIKTLPNTPISVATFSDGTDNPLKSLTASIEPVQNLHGYDAPWAGGAGKNKFNSDTITANAYIIDSGAIVSGAQAQGWCISDYTIVAPNTEYTFNPNSIEGNAAKSWFYDANKEPISYIASGGRTFTTPANCAYMRFSFRSTSTNIQLELGSTATSYAPYSNICPISGWTEEVITRCGKNLAYITYGSRVPSISTGDMVSSYGWSSDFFELDKNKSFVASTNDLSGVARYILFYDENKTYLGYVINYTYSGYILNNNQYWNNAKYIKHRVDAGQSAEINLQLEIGTTATTFEPYAGTTTTIPFNTTVYGGEIDVINGVVTPCPYYASYNGETLTGEWISDRDVYSPNTTPTTGAQVVNIGATGTPFSVQPTSIKSLEGDNNIYASTGDVEDLKYFADL